MPKNKFAFLNEAAPSWGHVIRVLSGFSLLLVGCHLLSHFVLLPKYDGNYPQWIAVHPRELKSLSAVILGNFFHKDPGHLERNLLVFWLVGLWVLKQEKSAAIVGMIYGALFCGMAQWLFGEEGTRHFGFSGVNFSLLGILIIGCIRIGVIAIVPMCFAVFFIYISGGYLPIFPIDDGQVDNGQVDDAQVDDGQGDDGQGDDKREISWIGHLGGMIGGMYSQVNNPRIALQILARSGWMTVKEAMAIHTRMESGAFPNYDKEEKESDSQETAPSLSPSEKAENLRQVETDEKKSVKISCGKCGTVNNIPRGKTGRPVCGKCGKDLPRPDSLAGD